MAIASSGLSPSGIAVVAGISDSSSFTYRISDDTKHYFNLNYLAD
jgi:hypothetical protein